MSPPVSLEGRLEVAEARVVEAERIFRLVMVSPYCHHDDPGQKGGCAKCDAALWLRQHTFREPPEDPRDAVVCVARKVHEALTREQVKDTLRRDGVALNNELGHVLSKVR